MSDIRSFFGPKGGCSEACRKTCPKEEARKVVEEDSDDEVVPEPKKPVTRSTPKNKAAEKEVKGTETTASEYFASSKAKPKPAAKAETKSAPEKKIEVRASPRNKKPAVSAKEEPAPAKKTRGATLKRYDMDDDEDAFMDDDDGEGGDDIFAADVKSRNKRKNDDYVEEESEEEFLPKSKRLASRTKREADDEDDKPLVTKSTKAATTSKKRKTPEAESDEEDEEPVSKKKPAPKKPRAPRAKKEVEAEDTNIQAILDDIPTVRPPSPPKDPNVKFDWRKAQAGAGNSGPPPNPTDDVPEGEEDCLTGLTFVFTGQLTGIAREEAQVLVKRYGGKVTGQPSSKTSYVVLGADAGPSKLAKIKANGIKTIDENGLFELIRRLPAGGGTGKGAEKVREKRQKEEEKIKAQAAEMEREEKARKLEAEKARKLAAARGMTGPAPTGAAPTAQLWTSKYAPTQPNHICGNKAAVEKIQKWLRDWAKSRKYDFQKRGADGLGGYRALEGFDVLEQNASDTRSKKLVESGVSEVMNNTSLSGYFAGDGKKVDKQKKNIVLVMDEVDGMSAGDRGGVGALAKFCKKTEVPMILICNERRLPKMKPFDFVALDIPFRRPTIEQIRSRMMTVSHREGLKLTPQVLDALIEGSNRDIRQIINMMSTIKLDQTSMDFDQSKDMSKAWEKSIQLYFNDHEFSYLMIQENYLRTKPSALGGGHKREQDLKALELMDKAAESISDGDLVDRMIHGPQQHWSLMPTHAVFSTVRPASFVDGSLMGSTFTSWLGNNSSTESSADILVRQQYLPVLWTQLVKRLQVEGKEAADEVIDLMDSYFLTREDFDSIKELGVGTIKDRIPSPSMKASSIAEPKKVAKDVPDLEEAIEEEDEGDAAEPAEANDDEGDITKDKYIKQPKAKPKRAPKKAAKAAKDDDDEDEDVKPAKGKGQS
ncbi:ATPase family associated with various cellular activities (AAA) domain-containing protein [Apiospora phragmitis]|uniref:Replication factor C subunit 1 n=1 Tax=Apiospora phragmitis TaxID=2905665 RepID=A0ABR1WV62_9PEZI